MKIFLKVLLCLILLLTSFFVFKDQFLTLYAFTGIYFIIASSIIVLLVYKSISFVIEGVYTKKLKKIILGVLILVLFSFFLYFISTLKCFDCELGAWGENEITIPTLDNMNIIEN
ncbi:MAG: hypothetical protein ABH951_01595 [Patescibacteria group bacterium]